MEQAPFPMKGCPWPQHSKENIHCWEQWAAFIDTWLCFTFPEWQSRCFCTISSVLSLWISLCTWLRNQLLVWFVLGFQQITCLSHSPKWFWRNEILSSWPDQFPQKRRTALHSQYILKATISCYPSKKLVFSLFSGCLQSYQWQAAPGLHNIAEKKNKNPPEESLDKEHGLPAWIACWRIFFSPCWLHEVAREISFLTQILHLDAWSSVMGFIRLLRV